MFKSTLLLVALGGAQILVGLGIPDLGFGLTPTPNLSLKATVYKSPTCDCCSRWENHLRKNGFTVDSHPTTSMVEIKSKNHVPFKARSCHTALIEGYVVEGHVPADVIKRLIKEHPAGVVGITVPRMPVGSPGMEGPEPVHYDILTFDASGKTKVFERR